MAADSTLQDDRPTLRYTESKERSAELLRLALAQIGRYEAACNPVAFAVWYEHVAQVNPPLSAEIHRLESQAGTLDDEVVWSLYQRHVAPTDAQAMERIGLDLQRVMSRLADAASTTGERAGAFDTQLAGLEAAMRANDLPRLAEVLARVLAGTADMTHAARALGQDLSASQAEIERLRAELQRARVEALVDPLTTLLNRKGFDQRMQGLLAQPADARRHDCLVMFDIDHFKRVNDGYGHLIGDRVIHQVGRVLRAAITDPAQAVARYGGEEFALLAPATTVDEALRLAEQMRARVKALRFCSRRSQQLLLTVTLSAGLTARQPGDDAASLIARADQALYRSKQRGRDCLSLG
jgi:diguanylate cyclase